jgi:thiamine-phosphate pyrophosphorylase
MDTLRAICQAVSIPVVAIGGINVDNILKLKGTGIDGVAVVSAVFAAENVKAAAEDLARKVKCL